MMNTTPNSKPEKGPASSARSGKIVITILKYLGYYLLGIVACVVLSPVEFELAGKFLLPFYLIYSLFGYVIWPFISSGESPFFYLWYVWLIHLTPFICGAYAIFSRNKRFRAWHPFWIAFPIGFAGTTGIYWAGMMSI